MNFSKLTIILSLLLGPKLVFAEVGQSRYNSVSHFNFYLMDQSSIRESGSTAECEVKKDLRQSCGRIGITKSECSTKSCCWDNKVINPKQKCFKKNNYKAFANISMRSNLNNTIQMAQELVNLTRSTNLSVSNPTLNFILENIHHLVSHPAVMKSMRDFLLKSDATNPPQTTQLLQPTSAPQLLQEKRNSTDSAVDPRIKVDAFEVNQNKRNYSQDITTNVPNKHKSNKLVLNKRRMSLTTYPFTTNSPKKQDTTIPSIHYRVTRKPLSWVNAHPTTEINLMKTRLRENRPVNLGRNIQISRSQSNRMQSKMTPILCWILSPKSCSALMQSRLLLNSRISATRNSKNASSGKNTFSSQDKNITENEEAQQDQHLISGNHNNKTLTLDALNPQTLASRRKLMETTKQICFIMLKMNMDIPPWSTYCSAVETHQLMVNPQRPRFLQLLKGLVSSQTGYNENGSSCQRAISLAKSADYYLHCKSATSDITDEPKCKAHGCCWVTDSLQLNALNIENLLANRNSLTGILLKNMMMDANDGFNATSCIQPVTKKIFNKLFGMSYMQGTTLAKGGDGRATYDD